MAHTIREDAEGLPWGVYNVFYYTVRGDDLVRQAGGDSNADANDMPRLPLGPNEVARAICRSQPGGAWVCGSRKAEQALLRWLESQP